MLDISEFPIRQYYSPISQLLPLPSLGTTPFYIIVLFPPLGVHAKEFSENGRSLALGLFCESYDSHISAALLLGIKVFPGARSVWKSVGTLQTR